MFCFKKVDLLTTQLSEKLVSHVLKFIGGEIETTRHLGFYAKWSHCILMHHGLWIRRRWKDLLPILNQLHKSLTTKSQELSEVCDRNLQSIDFLLRMATVKKEMKNAKKVGDQEEEIQSDGKQTADYNYFVFVFYVMKLHENSGFWESWV